MKIGILENDLKIKVLKIGILENYLKIKILKIKFWNKKMKKKKKDECTAHPACQICGQEFWSYMLLWYMAGQSLL